jgi:hypothetical protein
LFFIIKGGNFALKSLWKTNISNRDKESPIKQTTYTNKNKSEITELLSWLISLASRRSQTRK